MPKRVVRHVGNRGAVLALLGLVWVLRGTVVHPYVTDHRLPKPVLLHELLPLWATLLVWSLPGAIALFAAWWRRIDATAWGLLLIGPCMWSGSDIWGLITWVYPPAWKGLVVWIAVGFLTNRCAAGLDRAAPWDGRERRRWTQDSPPSEESPSPG